MLADVLEGAKDHVLDELERRAAVTEPTEPPKAGRRRRLATFVDEVIRALRRGEADGSKAPLTAFKENTLELRERELVRRYLVEEVDLGHTPSPCEAAIVSAWASEADRKRLREQNERFRALLDSVQDSTALFGPDGRILYCNAHALERLRDELGVRRDEIVGRTPAELGVPGELVIGRPIEELLPLARRNESFEMTFGGRTKAGQFTAVYGPDGTVTAVSLVVRDVHSERLDQKRLDLFTKLNGLVGITEHEEVAEALTHVPIPEIADWCAVSLVHDDQMGRTFVAHRDPSRAPLRSQILGEVPAWDRHPLWSTLLTRGFQLLTEVSDDLVRRLSVSEEQYRLLTQLGMWSLLVVPMVSRGKVVGIITLAYTEDSGRRYGRDDPPLAEEVALHAAHTFENARLMKELKSSEARFHIALATARTVVFEQDTALRYVWNYNPLVGVDTLGKTHEEVFPPNEAALLTDAKTRVLRSGESIQHEIDLTLGTEECHHFRERIEPLREHSGKLIGVIGAATDITEEYRTRQRLTDELDFREQMMGILGHDLRSPLNTVLMSADHLMQDQLVAPEGRSHVVRIRRSAGRMQEMIATLLDFTRARFTGTVPVSRIPADLAEISRAAVDEIHAAWPDRAVQLEAHGDPRGDWDPARMTQTITNLVTNAIVYGEADAPIRVTIEPERGDDELVDVKVHNDGPPIPPELVPALFEPFHRGNRQDRSPGGLGLGLYIARQIVQAHEGSISVESTENEGTTFTLHMPRRPSTDGHAAAAR
jgi:PAS domain S-box-containing protein